jgi:hypothetical protein
VEGYEPVRSFDQATADEYDELTVRGDEAATVAVLADLAGDGPALEHVIGFHDVLLLRPIGATPDRPRHDPLQRWILTHEALRSVFSRPGLFDGPIDVPAVGNNPPTRSTPRLSSLR